MPLNVEMKILVVDDFTTTRKMEVSLLKGLGYTQIVEAIDGESAIQILRADKDFQLIISDWNMPNKTGYDLLLWVRKEYAFSEIPFIMATALGEKKTAAQALEAGATDFISKPFTADELQHIIERAFGKKEVAPEPKPSKSSDSGKVRFTVAHIQITDHLILGILKHLIDNGTFQPKYFELETRCMPGWNLVQQALENGMVDAAFVLAPIAIDLFKYGVPIRLVMIAHRNGSICVRKKKELSNVPLRKFFKNKLFYLPHVLSIHHMLSTMFLWEIGMKPGMVGERGVDVFFEVVPPVKMPQFLKQSPDSCGFMVAQPVGAKAIADGGAEHLFVSGELWENHPCCIVAVRKEFIDSQTDALYEFSELLVQAGLYINDHIDIASEIAVGFLDPDKSLKLNTEITKNVLTEAHGIRTNDLYPYLEDLDTLQRYMAGKMGIGSIVDMEKFVDLRFAEIACRKFNTIRTPSKLVDPSDLIKTILNRQAE